MKQPVETIYIPGHKDASHQMTRNATNSKKHNCHLLKIDNNSASGRQLKTRQ